MFEHKPKVTMVQKKELKIILRYLGNMSNIAKTKLAKNVNKDFKFYQVKVLFKATTKLKNYFHYKD